MLVLNPSDKKSQKAKIIKTQRPLEEINFEIKVLKDSVAVLEKKKADYTGTV